MTTSEFRPVFVVGCQRSGSTLLGAMLGSHPDMICVPEAQFLTELMHHGSPDQPVTPADLIDKVERHWRFRVWEYDLRGRRPGPDDCTATFRGTMEWLVRQYDRDHGSGRSRIWVEQQPGHVRELHRLFRHFPDARAINVIRDGRAVAASIMPLDWGPNEIMPAAYFWEQRVARGFTAAAFLRPDQLMHIRYEDIVRNPEEAMRRCAAFIGVDYQPSMLTTVGLRLPRFTRGQHGLIGSLPNPKRIDAWKEKLTPRQTEIFEAINGDLLSYLGYTLETVHPRPVSFLTKVQLVAMDQLKRQLNAFRFRRRQRPYEPDRESVQAPQGRISSAEPAE